MMEATMTDTDPDFAVGATARRIAYLEKEIKRLRVAMRNLVDAVPYTDAWRQAHAKACELLPKLDGGDDDQA
jgi:hypothetical protein